MRNITIVLFTVCILSACTNTTLLAVNSGNVQQIMDIPQEQINKPLILGRTPLLHAAVLENTASVEALLKRNANPNISNLEGVTPLMEASAKGSHEIVKLLLESGANTNAKNKFDSTALHYAADQNFPLVSKLLIQAGAELNERGSKDLTALALAALSESKEIVEQLITAGADLNTGNPAIVQTGVTGNIEIANLLIRGGADVNATNSYGVTALIFAAEKGKLKLVELLLQSGADINKKENQGVAPLSSATIAKNYNIMRALINAGANMDLTNSVGITSLFHTAVANDYIASKILLESGANPDLQNNNGSSAIMEATFSNNIQIVRQLINFGADLNGKTNHGDTAIVWAISKDLFGIVRLLIDGGADPYIKNNRGQNAFDYVNGRQDYLDVLNSQPKKENRPDPEYASPPPEDSSPKRAGTGSGFYINSEGYIITNNHVVDSCTKIEAFDGKEKHNLETIHLDTWNDLALIRNTTKRNVSHVVLSNTNTVSLGEELVALGYPLTSIMGNSIKLTTGTLSGSAGIGGDTSKYQISVPIQPGNSGGPVFDSSSNVIGVVVSRLSDSYMLKTQGQIGQNVNFAVKSSVLKSFLEANDINYSAGKNNQVVNAKDIYKRNKESVLMIICYR